MSGPPSRRGRLLLALVLLASSGLLQACRDGAESAPPSPGGDGTTEVAPDVVRTLQAVLDRRAAAVRRGDADAFEAGLARRPTFVRAQRTWLANLAQLPVQRLGYTVDPGSLVRRGSDYWVVVERRLQLRGFDPEPVTTADRFLFTPGPRPGQFLLAATRDRAWERRHDVRVDPWDAGPVVVRSSAGVLGVFDAAGAAAAPELLGAVQDAIGSVAPAVPYDWSRSVVVYALSDPRYLASLADVPGDALTRVGGVAFPVAGTPGDRPVSTRVVLNPDLLSRDDPERDRLLRHELTHVAVGRHDDRVPVWLAEGVAELVSVGPMAPQDRLLPPAAVAAASRVEDLPDDDTFNDEDSALHYAVSWWACEYVAQSYGDAALWSLVDAMDDPGADPEEVLELRLGLSSADLAERAGRMIEATFGRRPGVGATGGRGTRR